MFARGYAFFKGVRFRGVSLYNVFPVCLTSAMLQWLYTDLYQVGQLMSRSGYAVLLNLWIYVKEKS